MLEDIGIAHGSVAVVASEHRLKFAHAIRSGLEAMGLSVILVTHGSELAGRTAAFEHVLFCDSADSTALELGGADRTQVQSMLAPVNHHNIKQIQTIDLNSTTTSREQFVTHALLSRVTGLKAVLLRIAPTPEGNYQALGALPTGDEGEIAPMTPADAEAAINHFAALVGIPGNVLGTSDMLTGSVFALVGEGLFRLEMMVHGPVGSRTAALELDLQNPRQVEILEQIAGGKLTGAKAEFSFPAPGSEGYNDEPVIVQFVNALLQHAWRTDANCMALEPEAGGAQVLISVSDTWLIYDTIPAPYAEHVVERIRAIANLPLVNRKLVQVGRVKFRAAGEDVHIGVTVTPTDKGDRVDLKIDRPQLESLPAIKETRSKDKPAPLTDKLVMMLGDNEFDDDPRDLVGKSCRRLIATNGPVDTSETLLFVLMFYRSIIRQVDERAAFKKAKSAVLTGDEVRLYD